MTNPSAPLRQPRLAPVAALANCPGLFDLGRQIRLNPSTKAAFCARNAGRRNRRKLPRDELQSEAQRGNRPYAVFREAGSNPIRDDGFALVMRLVKWPAIPEPISSSSTWFVDAPRFVPWSSTSNEGSNWLAMIGGDGVPNPTRSAYWRHGYPLIRKFAWAMPRWFWP